MHVICAPLLTTMELFERICCPLHCISPTPGGLTLKATLTITASLLPSMIDRVFEPVLVTYTMLETEFTATRLAIRGNCVKIGIFNTGSPLPSTRRRLGLTVMLLVILFTLPSITETVLDCMLVTYILLVSGFTAIPTGLLPTVIVPDTLFILPSITDTVLDCMLVTYILLVSGFIATP